MTRSVVGVYNSVADAEDAIEKLNSGGFPINQVSIAAQDLVSEKQVDGFVTAGDVAKSGAGAGAW